MKNLSYEMYRTNPAIREQLEEEARRMRDEAFRQYIGMPIARLWAGFVANLRVGSSAPRVPKSV